MSEHRFRIGDTVRVFAEPAEAKILLGPFIEVNPCGAHRTIGWVCRRPNGEVQFLRDSLLEPIGRWVPCPGKHRCANPSTPPWDEYERWEE